MLTAVIAVALVGAALPVLAFALAPAPGRSGLSVRARALVHPVGSPRAGGARYLAPLALVTKLERNLALAALSTTWPVGKVIRTKLVLTGVSLVLALLFVVAQPTPLRVILALVVLTVAYFGPDLVVWGRAQERQDAIRQDLADTLDQITISIEAGLGLETAIIRAGEHGTGPLAQELMRTIQDMRVGLSRKEAYTALADRTSVTDLKRFARAIMQADAYGVSVSNVVRTQSKDLRAKRRQRAEEKAMKVPVQVLFPLMLCILPVLFIVVLGPAVVNLVSVLGASR
jgi:tight adherence protein C